MTVLLSQSIMKSSHHITKILSILTAVLFQALLTACAPDASIPQNASPVVEEAKIFPDYRDVVIPPNIAPLNVMVQSEGDAFVGSISGGGKEIVAAADADGKLKFDADEWKELLEKNKGKDLTVQLYAEREGNWAKFPAYKITVAEEPIDKYLSYRLIEPSYELYRQLGLYQRDLETFEQETIYENNDGFDEEHNHCVNCHNYQNYDTQRMLFHVRAAHGGTMLIENGKIEKLSVKADSILGGAVYPTWHPKRNWVVFSSNKTGQAFYLMNRDRIEVVDYGSDLIFYDADNNTVSNVLKTDDAFETFPCWAPDGKKLYYCSVETPEFVGMADSAATDLILQENHQIRYNIYSMTFDEKTRSFGEPQLEVKCDTMQGGGNVPRFLIVNRETNAAQPLTSEDFHNIPAGSVIRRNPADTLGLSATVPRVSPDGRYLLFTLGRYGQFHIWHRTSDLWVKDLQTGSIYPLKAANSNDVDSYHTWSSNGRWIVFSSRRIDGDYTRPFIAYFDKNGQAHKAFVIPQEDPEQHTMLLKSYNVPELTRTKVPVTHDQLKEVIYDDNQIKKVNYKPLK